MSIIVTTALCLRKVSYSETSQILTLLTDRLGIVGAIAKGARRQKSRGGGPLDPMSLYQVVLYDRSRRGVLSILTEVELLDFFPGARKSYEGFRAAESMRELLLSLELGEDDGRGVLLLTVKSMRALDAAVAASDGPETAAGKTNLEAASGGTTAATMRLLARFAWGLLGCLGVEPVVTHCVASGEVPSGRVEVGFSVDEMGLLAPPHGDGRTDLIRLRPSTLAALRALAMREESEWTAGERIQVDGWTGAFTLLAWLVSRQAGRNFKVAPRLDPARAI